MIRRNHIGTIGFAGAPNNTMGSSNNPCRAFRFGLAALVLWVVPKAAAAEARAPLICPDCEAYDLAEPVTFTPGGLGEIDLSWIGKGTAAPIHAPMPTGRSVPLVKRATSKSARGRWPDGLVKIRFDPARLDRDLIAKETTPKTAENSGSPWRGNFFIHGTSAHFGNVEFLPQYNFKNVGLGVGVERRSGHWAGQINAHIYQNSFHDPGLAVDVTALYDLERFGIPARVGPSLFLANYSADEVPFGRINDNWALIPAATAQIKLGRVLDLGDFDLRLSVTGDFGLISDLPDGSADTTVAASLVFPFGVSPASSRANHRTQKGSKALRSMRNGN